MVANESCGYGKVISRSPEVVLPSSEVGVHFISTVPRFSREEGVAGGKNNLKCQWVVKMSSGLARWRAESKGKRIHVPRRLGCCSCKDEVAGGHRSGAKMPFSGILVAGK